MKIAAHEPERSDGERDLYPGLHVKAAALFEAVLRSQALPQANERLALLAAIVFLNLNGYDLDAEDGDLVSTVIASKEERLGLLQLAAAFESVTLRMEPPKEE